MNAIEIEKLSKTFDQQIVLNQLSMTIPQGVIYGFVGENGAGKTTTMKIILGLLKQDVGQIQVLGNEVTYGQTATNQFIGYLPDVPEFYDYLSAREYLRLCGEVTHFDRALLNARIHEVLGSVGLKDTGKKIGGYSRGMKQRLGLAQALLNDPKILICDEPTSALDPTGRKEMLEILNQIKGNTTILFSTHILSDVERICDYVGILHHGELKAQNTLEHLKQKYAKRQLLLTFMSFDEQAKAQSLLAPLGRLQVDSHQPILTFDHPDKNTSWEVLNILTQNHLIPQGYSLEDTSLESIFAEVTQ